MAKKPKTKNMFSVFADVRKQIRFKKEHPTVESAVFVSMKAAMVATLASCALCTAKTYIGDNINCVTGFPGQEHKAIETYCFIASTFSMVNLSASVETPYPGLAGGEMNEDTMTRHAYYQWVPMVLVIQTAVLYFPRWFWKNLDRNMFNDVLGKADMLELPSRPAPKEAVRGATTASETKRDEADGGSEKKKKKLGPLMLSAQYMAATPRLHTRYALKFLLCELIACVISLGNLFFTNAFLGAKFFWFGRNALSYIFGEVTDIDNPLNQVFPKIAKCTWHKFGATGSIQSFDSMCVLPLNIVNEKTYVFLWLVYITTTCVVAASLLWHIALAFFKNLRNWYILRNFKNHEAKRKYNDIKSEMNYGDWFMMKHLSRRMVPKNFEKWFGFYSRIIEKQMKNESMGWNSDSEVEE